MQPSWMLFVCALVAMTAGCMGGGATHDVSAVDNQFQPNSLSVDENDKISVKNNGNNLHSVTIHKVGDPATQTKADHDIPKGTSTEHTFSEDGTFHVYCKYHSGGSTGSFSTGMVLTVTVKAA